MNSASTTILCIPVCCAQQKRLSLDDAPQGKQSTLFCQYSIAVIPSKEQREEIYEAWKTYSIGNSYGESGSGMLEMRRLHL
jgi:hypothetical protein